MRAIAARVPGSIPWFDFRTRRRKWPVFLHSVCMYVLPFFPLTKIQFLIKFDFICNYTAGHQLMSADWSFQRADDVVRMVVVLAWYGVREFN